MSGEPRVHGRQWLRHVAWVSALSIFVAVAAIIFFFGSGLGNPLIRHTLVRRLEAATGARVEVRTVSIHWLALRATLKGLEIHGHEPAGTEPLFSAEEIQAGLRIDSLWHREFSLDDLMVRQPRVHIRVAKDGSSNVPTPPRPLSSKKPLRETLFDLHVKKVQIENGWIFYNDVRTPMTLEGGDLRVALDASGPLEQTLYSGNIEWKKVVFTAQRYLPIPIGIAAKFTLGRDGLHLDQGIFSAARSHMDAQADMTSFDNPHWKFKYRGWVELADFRDILRQPLVPTGHVDIHGDAALADGKFTGAGGYFGQNIALPYDDYHVTGLSSRGNFRIDEKGLDVPDFFAAAAGGTVKGHVALRFAGLQFRATTHIQEVRLAQLLPSIEHRGFPIDDLHWDALLDGDTEEIWTGAFEHFEISGKMRWVAPEQPAAGHQPVNANWQFQYRYDPNLFTVVSGSFETPASHGSIAGLLAPKNSGMDLKFETTSLETYKDFINALRDAPPGSADAQKPLSGSVTWDGKISGPAGSPTFSGHASGKKVRYADVILDSLDGDLTYSAGELSLARGHAQRGDTAAALNLTLALTQWSFLPENNWAADARFEKTPLRSMQELVGWSYPISGLVTGDFHGRGTREKPSVTGLFDLADGNVYGLKFNHLRGQLNATTEEVRIANAELRFFPSGENAGGAGIVTGMASYRFAEQTLSTDLVGAGLPLENFQKLQSPNFPMGGLVSFRLKASGPVKAPEGQGTFHIVDLRVGHEVIGSFDADLSSNGQTAHMKLSSSMTTGEISGGYDFGLQAPYPVSGTISIKNIDLDPFLLATLHLKQFSGQAKADGDISLKGSLSNSKSFVAEANFSRLAFNYGNVQLENSGPVRFKSSMEMLEIEPVTLHGTDTDMKIDGSVQFVGHRNLSLRVNGALNLRLISGFVPDIDVRGPAQINASVEGTMNRPRITGRVHVDSASVRAADFPTGLSSIKGDLIFDSTRAFFNEVTAEVGGGTLQLSGSVNYGEGHIRYDLNTNSDRVRIRYPEGMSWLVGGALRLTGTPDSGTVSGRVVVQRVTLAQGLESASSLVSSQEGISGPSTNSSFLRNLQFDVEAASSPDARMEWPGAQLEAEANLRVRGTFEHPILLGHIHLLSGDLYFAGNRYRVARGDINFANPFRLDPVLNVEATTTIQQYEITLNFNGPSSKLALVYRSDPPLPANDIVTLLALGKTSSEATSRSSSGSQSMTSGATALLSEAVSSQLGGRLERLFGITRFRVDPGLATVGSTGSEQNAGARVTVEQQITHNLTITYVSNVSSTQQQVIQVEYTVNRNVSIVALRDQNGTFGIDVKIKKRFK